MLSKTTTITLLLLSTTIAYSTDNNSFINYLEKRDYNAWSHYYPVLSRLIRLYNLKVGAEIGVASGGHSEYILKSTSVTRLYSIDPYMPYKSPRTNNIEQLKNKQVQDALYTKVNNKLKRYGNRSVLLRKTSEEGSKLFKDGQLDFVFIDANHDYEFVKQDIELWFSKVKSGGLVSGDDYLPEFPGVRKAVDEFFKEKNIKVKFDNNKPRIWYVIKP